MCESICRGNINQIGRNAWASMIDSARELVVDHINDLKVESADENSPHHPDNAERLLAEIHRKQGEVNT